MTLNYKNGTGDGTFELTLPNNSTFKMIFDEKINKNILHAFTPTYTIEEKYHSYSKETDFEYRSKVSNINYDGDMRFFIFEGEGEYSMYTND